MKEKFWSTAQRVKPMDGMFEKLSWSRVHNTKLLRLGLSAVALCLFSCGEAPVFREEGFYPQIKQPAVTVRLPETKNGLSVSSNGSFAIGCFRFEGEPSTYYASAEMLVRLSDSGISLSQKTQGELEDNLCLVSLFPIQENCYLYLNGKPYRGGVEIKSKENTGSLVVLNQVYVEDYLKGVVAAEMGRLSRQEIEALKAQAVAARTYSLSRVGQRPDRGYDLEATVADQVYGGVGSETSLANRAVELTRGEVLTHQGKLICAYYHANSGGRTEYIERVWDEPKEDYLIPVDDQNFCSWSENYAWKETWTKETLGRNLDKFLATSVSFPGGELGDVVNLKIRKRSDSGRVEALDVVTDWGSYRIHGDKIRWALRRGSNRNSILPSTCFDLEIQRKSDGAIQSVVARGRGNGHGVGMCQTGAIGMAREGYSYDDILMRYYSGAKLSPHYGKGKLVPEEPFISDSSCD